MSSLGVSKQIFEEALLLHRKENFIGSTNILQHAMKTKDGVDTSDTISIEKAQSLLGWNLVALRDFSGLETWGNDLSNFGNYDDPEFELIRIWILGIQGKTSDAIIKADVFLNKKSFQTHELLPGFLVARGRCYSQAGNAQIPIVDCEAAYSIFLIQKNKFGAGKAANILGTHYHLLGDFSKALEWYSRSFEIFDSLNLQKKRSVLKLNQGVTNYKIGNFPQSIQLLKQSLKIGITGNWIHRQCFANIALGTVYRMTRNLEKAQRHLKKGLKQAQSLSMAREEALAYEFLGDTHRDNGCFDQAQHCYAAALAIIIPLAPQGDVVSETHRRIGECYMLNGEYLSAKPHLQKALEMTLHQGDRFEEAVTLRVMAQLELAMKHSKRALKHIIPACDILEEIGASYELALARFEYAEILIAERNRKNNNIPAIILLDHAWRHASDSQTRFNETGVQWWMAQAQDLVKRISQLHSNQEEIDLITASSSINQDGECYNPGNIIVHKSSSMRQLLKQCDLYAASNSSFLIRGETGTGKELIAHRLHEKSGRTGKLVSVNVASISPSLFEREFFGHVKGAFSGADRNSLGFAESAHKGTLFLDEIGELPLDLQPKLLRLLQDGSFNAVGDPAERKTDIRIIAATNVDLYKASQAGTFREDLYYRLQVLSVTIPPLKERSEDILPLMEHFLSIAAYKRVRLGDYLNPAALDSLETYSWPGNVREVVSVCQQIHLQVSTTGSCAVALGQSGGEMHVLRSPQLKEMEAVNGRLDTSTVEPYERLVSALETTGGNRQKAAALLQISRSTLYRHLKEFDL